MAEKFNGIPISIVHFDADGKVTGEENYNLDKVVPDKWALKGLADSLLPTIQEFYSHEENVLAFETWLQGQKAKREMSSSKKTRRTRRTR